MKNQNQKVSSYGTSLYIPNDVIQQESSNSFISNLTITQIGYFGNAYGHSISRRGIDEYIVIYCVDGRGWIETCNKRRDVGKGDLVFCKRGCPHSYGADHENPWSIHWIHFIGEGVPELLDLLDISEKSPILPVGEKAELLSLMNEAYKILLNGYSLPNLLYAATCFQEFFCHIIRLKMNSRLQNEEGNDVEDIIRFMLQNIDKNISLWQLADCVKMSKFHFTRRFKEKIGYPPIEYFNRLKIQKACELLDTSTYSIKEISNFLAFKNPFYFSEVFKRITGYSPKTYRSFKANSPKT